MKEHQESRSVQDRPDNERAKTGAMVGAVVGGAAFEVLAIATGAPLEVNVGLAIAGAAAGGMGGAAANVFIGSFRSSRTRHEQIEAASVEPTESPAEKAARMIPRAPDSY